MATDVPVPIEDFDSYIQAYIDFYNDEGNSDLEIYVGAIGSMFSQSEDAVRDPSGNPPFSMYFNPDTCPDNALAWLGQFVGVKPEVQSQFEDPAAYYARQRQRIKDHLGFGRGSAVAMQAAASLYLTGTQTVLFRERDGSPYHLTIVTKAAETPDSNKVLQALMAQKPAGITLDYHTIVGYDFAEVATNNATFDAAKAAYPTFNDMRGF
jgi:hypothetical protein